MKSVKSADSYKDDETELCHEKHVLDVALKEAHVLSKHPSEYELYSTITLPYIYQIVKLPLIFVIKHKT